MSKRAVLACLALCCASQALFLWRLNYPHGWVFDELYYVPAARAILARTINLNPQHPPLGKLLIAASIALFGDAEFGWRTMSTIFGTLTIAGVFYWAFAIFRKIELAVLACLVAMFNQMLYVFARTAMLDVFMTCFLVWGVAAVSSAWMSEEDPGRGKWLLIFGGAMFGFANACKWLGFVPWFATLLLVMVARFVPYEWLTRMVPTRTADGGDEPWIGERTFRWIDCQTLALAFVVAPLVCYFATFVPLMFVHGVDASLGGLWKQQLRIWQEHSYFGGTWVYINPWYCWPLTRYPMMFSYDVAGKYATFGRAVIFMGNPAVMWAGVAAALLCAWEWIRRGSRQAFLAVLWYAVLWLCWAVIPRRVVFYYYYFPPSLALSIAIAYGAQRWPRKVLGIRWYWYFAMVVFGVFLWKLPLISAMRVPDYRLPSPDDLAPRTKLLVPK